VKKTAPIKNIARIVAILSILILSLQHPAFAQEDPEKAEASLVKTSQNPVASLIIMPFQFNWNMGMGSYDRMQTVINIQPVLPVKIGKTWNMINRIILPVMVQPDLSAESGSTTGLGTINYTAFFSPEPFGKVSVGFGPSLLIPTNSADVLGDGQFAIGPSVVLFAGLGNWTLGFVAAQNWAYYTPNTASSHNSFFTQYFINYNLKKAWSIGTAPTITVNWNAEDGEKATVPFGLSLSKITHLGKQATKFILAYYYNAVRPQLVQKVVKFSLISSFYFLKNRTAEP
jgi:hypothetical protein